MPAASRPPSEGRTSRPQSIDRHPFLKEKTDVTPLRSFLVCLLYGTTSVCITFFNKALFSVYHFNFPAVLVMIQLLVCITSLTVANSLRYITLPPLEWQMVKTVFPLSTCWWMYVVSGIAALRFLTIPMFSTLRKATALIVLLLETIVLRKSSRAPVWFCIMVMVGGGFIAGMTDLSFSLPGYILVSICCFATAMYLILIVRIGKRAGLDTFGLLYYNNIIAFPMMLLYLVFATQELENLPHFRHLDSPKFWAFTLFSAAQATILNVAIFLCTKLNSPLATTVTGQMKDFVTIGVGLFLFGDVKLSLPNLTGLAISLLGSLGYSAVKFVDTRRRANDK